MDRIKIHGLTGMRAIAAFLVFFSHFPIYRSTIGHFMKGVLAQGYIGVTLFYVLSGFLITYTYQNRMESGLKNYGRYFWRRFTRLYPVYFLSLLVTGVLIYIFNDFTQPLQGTTNLIAWLILQVTLLKGCFSLTVFSGVPQAWSLTVELIFYFLAPLIIVILRSRYKYYLIPLCYLIGAELLMLGIHENWLGFMGNLRFVVLYTFFGRSLEFVIGSAFAISMTESKAAPTKIPYRTYTGLIGIAAIQVALYLIQGPYRFGSYRPMGMVINNLVLPFFALFFIAGLVQEKSVINRILSSRLMQMLGKSSYAFYLFQFIIMSYLVSDFTFHIAEPRSIWIVLFGFIVLNIVSLGIYYFYEKPLNQWLNKFVAKPK